MRKVSKFAALLIASVAVIVATLAPAGAQPEISSGDVPEVEPVSSLEPSVTYGQIEEISVSEALGDEQARSVSKAARCNQQNVIMTYPELRFTGTKRWCYDGQRVTQGSMTVTPFVKEQHRYTQNRDGWVYVPRALKKSDRFLTLKGVERAAHESTRTGRFEYRIHGQAKPQVVYIPSVSRTAYGTGACKGPKPKDLAPKIVGIAPSPTEKNFTTKGNIVVRLNMEVKEGTSNDGTFYAINNKTGEYVQGATGRYTPDLTMAIIVPTKDMEPNTEYTVTVSGGPYGVLGKTGDPLITGKTWTFKTGAK